MEAGSGHTEKGVGAGQEEGGVLGKAIPGRPCRKWAAAEWEGPTQAPDKPKQRRWSSALRSLLELTHSLARPPLCASLRLQQHSRTPNSELSLPVTYPYSSSDPPPPEDGLCHQQLAAATLTPTSLYVSPTTILASNNRYAVLAGFLTYPAGFLTYPGQRSLILAACTTRPTLATYSSYSIPSATTLPLCYCNTTISSSLLNISSYPASPAATWLLEQSFVTSILAPAIDFLRIQQPSYPLTVSTFTLSVCSFPQTVFSTTAYFVF